MPIFNIEEPADQVAVAYRLGWKRFHLLMKRINSYRKRRSLPELYELSCPPVMTLCKKCGSGDFFKHINTTRCLVCEEVLPNEEI